MSNPKIDIEPSLEKRLKEEQVIWLTTVRSDGTPQPTPVWFIWDDGTFLIYSQRHTQKIRNLKGNRRVSLNLNSDQYGGEVVIFTGVAVIDTGAPAVRNNPAYIEKYREGISDINHTPDSMSKDYAVPIRIRPDQLRAF